MYGTNIINSLSFTKILGGISKTLGIVNQAIPIYKEMKPMIGNARKIISIVKEFGNTNITETKKIKNSTNNKIIDIDAKEKIDNYNQSNPVFFQ